MVKVAVEILMVIEITVAVEILIVIETGVDTNPRGSKTGNVQIVEQVIFQGDACTALNVGRASIEWCRVTKKTAECCRWWGPGD